MHECNGVSKFARIARRRWRLACLLNLHRSLCDQPAASVGANEGQMRQLIGYLVAFRGAEDAAARMAAGNSLRLLCKHFPRKKWKQRLCKGGHTRIDDKSIGAGIAIGKASSITHAPTGSVLTDKVLADSAPTSSPITIVYARENFADEAVEEIAGTVPDLGVFDCGSQAGQAAGAGARRR
jgi:hypothetical protein